MNKTRQVNLRLWLLLCLLTGTLVAWVQEPAFWNDVQGFKKKDSIAAPVKGQILFIGSSSFTKWQDVQDYFPGTKILNRAFGGSSLPDLIRYADDIIYPYQPSQVVIYCGENDLAASDTVTAQMVVERFQVLFAMIRKNIPGVPVVFVSLKPSPSRKHLFPKMLEANLAIKNFLKKKKRTAFVDVYYKMLKEDGNPMDDLFVEDLLHMNTKGYAIWQQLIAPHLLKK